MPNSNVTEPIKSKKIKIYRNGQTRCYNILINPRKLRSWNSILEYVTEVLQPDIGFIVRIISLSSMEEVECFEQLNQLESYVALPLNAKFTRPSGGYGCDSLSSLNKKIVYKKHYEGDPNPNLVPLLERTAKKNLKVVYIMVNGRTCQCPQKVVLNNCDLINWETTKNYLSRMLDVVEGIKYVATIFGDILDDPREMQPGFPYVLVPFKQTFISMDYLALFKEECGISINGLSDIRQLAPKETKSEGTVAVPETEYKQTEIDPNHLTEYKETETDRNHLTEYKETETDPNHLTEYKETETDPNHLTEYNETETDRNHLTEYNETETDRNHLTEYNETEMDRNHLTEYKETEMDRNHLTEYKETEIDRNYLTDTQESMAVPEVTNKQTDVDEIPKTHMQTGSNTELNDLVETGTDSELAKTTEIDIRGCGQTIYISPCICKRAESTLVQEINLDD